MRVLVTIRRIAIINWVSPVHASPGFPISGLLRIVSHPHLNYAIMKIFVCLMARCPSYHQPVWRISKLGATSGAQRQIWLKSSCPLFGSIQVLLLIAAPLHASTKLVLKIYQSLIHSLAYRFPWLKELMFVIVLKALTSAKSEGNFWELLYDDDLVLMADSIDLLRE